MATQSEKIRVLHLIPGLGWGGAENQLVLNLSALDRERFENYVCYLYPRHVRLPRVHALGVPATCLGLRSGKFQWPLGVLKLTRMVRRLKIDIVHTSNYEANLVGGVVGKLTGAAVVSTLTNVFYEDARLEDSARVNGYALRCITWLEGLIVKRWHQRSIAISEGVKRSAMRTLGLQEDRIDIIYRALQDDWFENSQPDVKECLKHDLGLEEAFPIVLNVGRLAPQKGQRYLIEATARCVDRFPKMKVLIAGTGYLLPELERLRDGLGLHEHVQFLGPRDDVKDLLDMVDIFAFPSLYEGLGNACLEAGARAKPCVLSDIGPLREVLPDDASAIFVPPGKEGVEALASALQKLAGDRDAADTMGNNALRHVKARFRIQQIIAQLERVYEAVVASGARVPARASGQSGPSGR